MLRAIARRVRLQVPVHGRLEAFQHQQERLRNHRVAERIATCKEAGKGVRYAE